MPNPPKSNSDFDPSKTPSDRDLMIRYKMALESIVATYEWNSQSPGAMNSIAQVALKTARSTD